MKIPRRHAIKLGGALALTTALQGTESQAAPAAGTKIRTIPLEEACVPAEVLPLFEAQWEKEPWGKFYNAAMKSALTDLGSRKVEEMDRLGIEMMVLSLTIPGPQGERDRAKAEDLARRANDALAKTVSAHPNRFAGLGCVSMHDVDAACREFERLVKTLGMRGVLLNNVQLVGDARGALFYDQPEFDAFWDTAQKLDVPVYLHPGPTPGGALDINGWDCGYGKFSWLHSATWFWAVDTGSHALRIITSGVFDRFPKVQLMLGHNGEHIVCDLWRIDDRLKNQIMRPPAKQPVRSYFRSNVHVTTSGEFSDFGLRHIIQEIGADRVLFAIDTPYQHIQQGASWFDVASISNDERQAIARGNAIRLLKLPLKP